MLFLGYYGMGNFGDDLFGHAAIHGASRWWGRDARVLSTPLEGADPEMFALRRGPLARSFDRPSAGGRLSRLVSKTAVPLTHRHLVYGGGSTFSRVKRWDVRRLYSTLARLNLQDVSAVGVSVGPFRSREEEVGVGERLRALSYLSLRDDASYDYASSLGLDVPVVRSADLAGTLPEAVFPRHREREEDVMGVNVCPALFAVSDEGTVVAELADVLRRRVLSQGIRVKLFSLQAHPTSGDAPVIRALRRALPEEGVSVELYDGDAPGMWEAIGSCRYVVSARLHGAITAYLQGVPFVMLGYHPKCAAFTSDVDHPEAQYVEADGHRVPGLDEAVSSVLTTPAASPESVDAYRQRAALNFSRAPWSR